MSHSTTGFFVGNLVIDAHAVLRGPLPDNYDGRLRIRVVSQFGGGSATNAAVTFGKLAALDRSNGGGTAHLYTVSEARTPPEILEDLESHNVHLKKVGITSGLGRNTLIPTKD